MAGAVKLSRLERHKKMSIVHPKGAVINLKMAVSGTVHDNRLASRASFDSALKRQQQIPCSRVDDQALDSSAPQITSAHSMLTKLYMAKIMICKANEHVHGEWLKFLALGTISSKTNPSFASSVAFLYKATLLHGKQRSCRVHFGSSNRNGSSQA